MVQWTTPFMIGITKMILNSYIPPPSSGYSISFPNQPLHACQDSNLKLLVLETSTLPIELHTHYFFIIPALTRNLRADFLFLQAFFVAFLIALTIWSICFFLMRSVQDSNLCQRFCRPTPNHSANRPYCDPAETRTRDSLIKSEVL